MSSSVKQQLIQDLQLAGLAPQTQKTYLNIVVRFVRCTGIRPQDATEAQVAEYLQSLSARGLCQGTIKPTKSALQFVFENTLGRDWGLFKKESPPAGASACPWPRPMPNVAASSPPSRCRSIASAWP